MSLGDPLAFGELFCGAGGMALGLRRAGFAPTWAIDADPHACRTYADQIGEHVQCAKVEEVDYSSLARVGGLAFGFPCNDFSMVGERKGRGGYFGGLYLEAVRALETTQPAWFIAENVPGLMASEGDEIMQAFADSGPGYSLSVHLYRFEEYGVPQRRARVIGVGIREDLAMSFRPPAPTHPNPVTVSQAMKGLRSNQANSETTKHTDKVIRLLESIPPGENAWHPDVPEDLRLNVPNVRLSLIYRRLKADEPAYTVVGSGGGGTHMYHWDEPRALTNRERARLQTFPDDFHFSGTKEAVRKQIGMAVPPLGAEVIGRALMAQFRGESYESVEPSVGLFRSAVRAQTSA
jgi:DNA (cytosine-5)-methyltransferase 1